MSWFSASALPLAVDRLRGCTALDFDGSKKVEINELVAAVARALRGCSA